MKGIAPKEVDIKNIYLGIIPFVIIQVIGVMLVLAFPKIALWLPNLVYN
jgi:TRAP-type mannitol/chloroaromatic compound transport system permease large subunit